MRNYMPVCQACGRMTDRNECPGCGAPIGIPPGMQGPPGYGAPPYGAPPYGAPPYGYAPPPGYFGSPPGTGAGSMSALIILCTVFGALGAVAAIIIPPLGFVTGMVVLALGAAATAMHDPRGWEGIGAGVIVIVVAVIFGFAFI